MIYWQLYCNRNTVLWFKLYNGASHIGNITRNTLSQWRLSKKGMLLPDDASSDEQGLVCWKKSPYQSPSDELNLSTWSANVSISELFFPLISEERQSKFQGGDKSGLSSVLSFPFSRQAALHVKKVVMRAFLFAQGESPYPCRWTDGAEQKRDCHIERPRQRGFADLLQWQWEKMNCRRSQNPNL